MRVGYSHSQYLCDVPLGKRQEILKQKQIEKPPISCPDLAAIKHGVLALSHKSKHCHVMLMSNLADPWWTVVDCSTKTLAHVVCIQDTPKQLSYKIDSTKNMTVCFHGSIKNSGKCSKFLSYNQSDHLNFSLQQSCFQLNFQAKYLTSIKQYQYLYDAVSYFPALLSPSLVDPSVIDVFAYRRVLNTYKTSHFRTSHKTASGVCVCEREIQSVKVPEHTHKCKTGEHISESLICDGKIDCLDEHSDESNCLCKTKHNRSLNSDKCKQVIFLDQNKTICGPLYYRNVRGSCQMFHPFSKMPTHERTNNSRTGHSTEESDPNLFQQVLQWTNEKNSECAAPNQVPCLMAASSICYNFSDICVYKLNGKNQLTPCQDGGNLENCGVFECNTLFKCHLSYCVVWSFVCDGKLDCPWADDESMCRDKARCQHLYKCKSQRDSPSTCIHLTKICDGQFDCVLNDDEVLCELKACPHGCRCLLYATTCGTSFSIEGVAPFPYKLVTIHSAQLLPKRSVALLFPNVTHLTITKSRIVGVCHQNIALAILFLNLQYIHIKYVSRCCFQSQTSVTMILLENDEIQFVEAQSFTSLDKLRMLSLSHNPLKSLPRDLCEACPSFKIMYLVNASLTDIDVEALNTLSLNFLKTENHHLCCTASDSAVCTAQRPWYISCSDLIGNTKQRTAFVAVSVLILSFCAISIVCHIGTRSSGKGYSIVVVAVNLIDLQCLVYLIAIWIADIVHRGTFMVKEEEWRSSIPCFLAAGTAMLYTVLSQFALVFLSVTRLFVVVWPMSTKLKRSDFVINYLICMFIISVLVCFASVSSMRLSGIELPLNLCLPYVDPSHSKIIVKTLTTIIVAFQILSSIVVVSLRFWLFCEIQKSQKIFAGLRLDRNKMLKVQLIILSISNILCWLPTSVVYVSTLIYVTYPMEMITWTTVLVLPLNSLLSPCVFVGVSVKKYVEATKRGGG